VIHNHWSDWDWDDYNYAQQAGCSGGRQGAGMRDPLSELCDNLPGLEAGDITTLLSDLPIPIPGDVPGMTVEEAVQFCVYHGIYHCMYHGILLDISYCIYHGIYHGKYSDIYHAIYHDIYSDIYLCIYHVTYYYLDTYHHSISSRPGGIPV
jgi:hypothetical protein